VTVRLAIVQDLVAPVAELPRHAPRPRHGAQPSVAEEVRLLALGMLWHPADADGATELILRAATEDRTPPGELRRVSVLRIAVRHLLSRETSLFERQGWTFEALAQDLSLGRDEPLPPKAFGTHSLALVDEVKLGCWQTMLLCLDRPHRMAYLLASLDDLDVRTGAALLELDVDAFRARASHAGDLVRHFLESHCGLVNRARPCHCSRRLGRALVTGRVDPDELLFARAPSVRAS
jgi:DNA-directed RNA polymerase specialized sigma24 family protein